MSIEAYNKSEAKQILDLMKERDFKFRLVEGVTYISYPNPNYKPGERHPFLACTLEHLILAIHNQ